MTQLHIVTPVKDSLVTTLSTIENIMKSETNVRFSYSVYNDFSTDENTKRLEIESGNHGFELINLKDITTHPSPNYLLILQNAQKVAINEGAHLLIVESDVIVEKNTIQKIFDYCSELDKVGMIAAVTVDQEKIRNFPYNYSQKYRCGVINTKKRLSFCCTLLSVDYLKSFDFKHLNPEKAWYDVFVSKKSIKLGFKNYLLTSLPVLHLPHSSRPWKLLKYSNPIKYYCRKLFYGLDKI